ncbi:MAG: ribosomal protein S18-alanine N-acetyltransferase [Mycobacterium sp.]
MTLVLEELTRDDAPRCAELETLLFDGDDPWPASAFTSALRSKDNHYVVARDGDTVVGYAGIARLGNSPPFEYEVHTIGVDPDHMCRGIGWRLLIDLLEFAAGGTVFLEVRTDNGPAIAMYAKAGFVTVGLRKRYYRVSGADAYTMRRDPPATEEAQ